MKRALARWLTTMAKRVTMSPRGRVLAAIADGEQHGIDIAHRAGVSAGTLYSLLPGLEREGLIHRGWRLTPTGERAVYTLTEAGQRVAP